MKITYNLGKYLQQHKHVLIRGVNALDGMRELKNYIPEDRTFMGVGVTAINVIEELQLPTGEDNAATRIMIGTCSEIHGKVNTKYPLWYFKNPGSDTVNRDATQRFDMVVDFSGNKILGAMLYDGKEGTLLV